MMIIKFIRSLFSVPRYVFFVSMGILSGIFPKKKGLWLFGSWEGRRYSSSTKYLFQYINENCENISPVWITREKSVYSLLKKKPLSVQYTYSLKGMWLSLRAEAVFVSHNSLDINPGFASGSLFIQLFHYIIPLKKMVGGAAKANEDDFRHFSLLKRIRLKLAHPHLFRKPDYFVSSSKWLAEKVTASKIEVSPDKILLTGFPRSDAILAESDADTEYLQSFISGYSGNPESRLIYYMPTHRDHDASFNPFSYGFDGTRFKNLLEKSNAYFIIRYHPRDRSRLNSNPPEGKRIVIEPEGVQDAYSVLRNSSVLITDYSSIFSDFLLLDRPIIFANFDHENYLKARGLNWDFDQYTPGYKAEDWNKVCDSLEAVLIDNNDEFREERNKLRNKIYKYEDTDNSARVVKKIRELLSTGG